MADQIADPLKAQRVSLRERPGDQHVAVPQREGQCVLPGEIHVGFIQNHYSFLGAAKAFEVLGAIAAATRSVRSSDEGQRRAEIPLLAIFQFGGRWQRKLASSGTAFFFAPWMSASTG